MKKELLLFQTEIGSSEQLLYLIKSINKYSSKESLIILSEKKGFLYRSETSASIEFLKWLKVIKVKDNKIKLVKSIENKTDLLKLLLDKLSKRRILFKLISFELIHYDDKKQKVYISTSSIPLRYSSLKHLLLSLGFFVLKDKIFYEISDEYVDYFIHLINNEKQYIKINTVALSLKELLAIKEIQAEKGRNAELQALIYEQKRLINHSSLSEVKIISEIDVTRGYDLVSFNSVDSTTIDRYIEVKSIGDGLNFFWSRNEVETAKMLGDNYYLYLVSVGHNGYDIEIINNPVALFNSNKWLVSPNSWEIKRS